MRCVPASRLPAEGGQAGLRETKINGQLFQQIYQ